MIARDPAWDHIEQTSAEDDAFWELQDRLERNADFKPASRMKLGTASLETIRGVSLAMDGLPAPACHAASINRSPGASISPALGDRSSSSKEAA